MYNRKSLTAALGLSVLLGCTSCSNDMQSVIASGDEITLAVGEWKPLTTSRATLFDEETDFTDPRQGGGNFTVYAYVDGTNEAYIRKAHVWCRNAPGDWVFLSGDGNVFKYYWPASEALNFFAYMPDVTYNGKQDKYHSESTYVTIGNYTDTDGQEFSCTLPPTVTISDDAGSSTAIPDKEIQEFICAYAAGLTKAGGKVTMHFAHPFATVEFQMKTAPVGLKINSISIEKIHLSGTCSVKSTTGGDNPEAFQWTTAENPEIFTVEIDKVVPNHIDTQLNVPIGDPHIVVPQILNDVKITIDYTYNGTTTTKSGTVTAADAVTEWKPGKKYTYALDFGNNDEDVLVEVSVENWISHHEQNTDVD